MKASGALTQRRGVLSHSSSEPLGSQEQAPFAGHPFGGLAREDRFGVLAAFENHSPQVPDDGAAAQANDDGRAEAADEWTGGFDFHLGVYARF
jgi:hypothetical protein